MTRVLFFSTALAATLALLLSSPIAQAQSAEVLIEQGLELRRQQRDAEALERFQDAYQMGHSAHALAQIALAEQALGRFALAELHMQQALAVSADPWIASRQAQLQQALTSMGATLGTIELQGGVEGAEVWVNGELRGTLPQAGHVRARAGTAVVEIRAPGYLTVQRQLNVTVGGTLRETVNLIAQAGTVGQPPLQQQQVVQQGYPQGQQGYVAQPGQPGQTYQQPAYQPPPTRTVSQPIWGLFVGGIPVFAVPWILTGTIDMVACELEDACGHDPGIGWIPVVAPWIFAAEEGSENSEYQTVLAIDGIIQLAGLTMIVLGLVLQRDVEVSARLGDDPEAPRITVLPYGGDSTAGLSVALTHL